MSTDKIGLVRYSDTGEVFRIVYPQDHEDESVLDDLQWLWMAIDSSRPREVVKVHSNQYIGFVGFGLAVDQAASFGEVVGMSDKQIEAAAKALARYELFDWETLLENDPIGVRDRVAFRVIATAMLEAAHGKV